MELFATTRWAYKWLQLHQVTTPCSLRVFDARTRTPSNYTWTGAQLVNWCGRVIAPPTF